MWKGATSRGWEDQREAGDSYAGEERGGGRATTRKAMLRYRLSRVREYGMMSSGLGDSLPGP